MALRIVADENIPLVREAFAGVGEVRVVSGRNLSRTDLTDADALLVRSVTQVDAALLENTPVRLVGTATSGSDHVDIPLLTSRGIGFGHALGCNAVSVAEYVLAALVHWSLKQGRDLKTCSLGIVGFGHVGQAISARARAFGMEVLINDPPRERGTAELIYRPMEDILECDVVTLHVPLVDSGLDPTLHLANALFFDTLKDGACFINTSRGEVVDSEALKHALGKGRLSGCILDVWENEPTPDLDLLAMTDIATPHIAGYSLDGKVRGTKMVHDALCRHFAIEHEWDPSPLLPSPAKPRLYVASDDGAAAVGCIRAAYDIMTDDAAFRSGMTKSYEERGTEFDRQRREYPTRREFGAVTVEITGKGTELIEVLNGLGFRVEEKSQ